MSLRIVLLFDPPCPVESCRRRMGRSSFKSETDKVAGHCAETMGRKRQERRKKEEARPARKKRPHKRNLAIPANSRLRHARVSVLMRHDNDHTSHEDPDRQNRGPRTQGHEKHPLTQDVQEHRGAHEMGRGERSGGLCHARGPAFHYRDTHNHAQRRKNRALQHPMNDL